MTTVAIPIATKACSKSYTSRVDHEPDPGEENAMAAGVYSTMPHPEIDFIHVAAAMPPCARSLGVTTDLGDIGAEPCARAQDVDDRSTSRTATSPSSAGRGCGRDRETDASSTPTLVATHRPSVLC